MLIGPATSVFVADVDLAGQLADIGVMLLMLGDGLHFSPTNLLAVRRIAIPAALPQIGVAAALGAGTAIWWGWGFGAVLVFGPALSVASTVVLLRALESRGVLESVNGRIAVGWLIVENFVMVLVLVLPPAVAPLLGGNGAEGAAPDQNIWVTLGITLAMVDAFIALIRVAARARRARGERRRDRAGGVGPGPHRSGRDARDRDAMHRGVRKTVGVAKTMNPGIEVVVRSHSEEEAKLLEAEQVGKTFMGEFGLAQGLSHDMAGQVLARIGRGPLEMPRDARGE